MFLLLFFFEKFYHSTLTYKSKTNFLLSSMILRIECNYFPLKNTAGEPFSKVYNIFLKKDEFIKFSKGTVNINWAVKKYLKVNFATQFILYVNYDPIYNNLFYTIRDGMIEKISRENIRLYKTKRIYYKRKIVKYVDDGKTYDFTDIRRSLFFFLLFAILFAYGLFQIFLMIRKNLRNF